MTELPVNSFLRRYPRCSAAFLLVFTVLITLAMSEIIARWLIAYQPGYYTAISGRRDTKGEVTYPYGTIRINSLGFPDEEFDLEDDRPRIGYFGDSVTFGVGAGYGYRITEILENYYPAMQHMNISGGLGAGVTASIIGDVLNWTQRLKLNKVVYLMNLNDISPGVDVHRNKTGHGSTLTKRIKANFDVLRGKSYLYTWARNVVKTFMISNGFGVQGISYELYPNRYDQAIEETANRVNYLSRSLRLLGVDLIVVVLPYEMQISREAERVYRGLGVKWGGGFIEGLTQRKLMERFRGVRVFDAMEAFVSKHRDGSERNSPAVGRYFVYKRGGRLDWNHPERNGHRRIAEYLARSAIFGQPEGLLTTPHGRKPA